MTGHGHVRTGIVFGILPAVITFLSFDAQLAAISYALCVVFSTAPDWLEIQRSEERMVRKEGKNVVQVIHYTVIPHRTITHIVAVWLAMAAIAINSILTITLPLEQYMMQLSPLVASCALGASCGGLIHLLWDIPNKKPIPMFTLWDRVGLNLWKSGKFESEIVMATFFITIALTGYVLHAFFIDLNSLRLSARPF